MGSTPRLSAPWRTRLEARLLLFVMLVTGASVAAMLVAATQVITAGALERSRQDQDAAKAAFDRLIEQRQEFAASQSRLITELPVFRAHLSDPQIADDSATLEALAQQYQQSARSDFLLVANARGSWLGRAHWPAGVEPTWSLLTAGAPPDDRVGHSALVALSDGLYLIVVEPALFVDEVLGWVAAGYRLDDGFAKGLARITHADVNLIAGGRLWGSSLEPAPREAVAALAAGAGPSPTSAELPTTNPRRQSTPTSADSPYVEWLQLGENRYSAREYPLAPGRDAGRPSLLLVKDWQPTQAVLDQVEARLLFIGLVAFCLAVAGTTVFSRRATRPLRDVVEAAHQITEGEWTRRVPVRGTSEAVAMAAAFNEMTTSLTVLNAQLATQKARAEAASSAKDQLLSNMSHELRTPLNGIMGMTALTLDTQLTDDQREYLEAVDTSAQALLAIVNDVLDFAKIDANGLMLDPAPFDLHDCFARCRTIVWPTANAKGLTLAFDVDPAVPVPVVGDEGRLRQIVLNLLSNAVKFTHTGSVTLRARVEATAGQALTLLVEVRDTGIGIPKNVQELIFQPFVQADGSMTRRYGGTGLGLSISARLVEKMGGRIWLESEEGAGTAFFFTAPL